MNKKSRLNHIFNAMKNRCCNPNYNRYNDYGGRGITLCDEWNNRESVGFPRVTKGWKAFEKWAMENGYEDNLSIDRIDNNKGYSPDNCRWVTDKIQANNKRSNCLITYKGKTQTLVQWCEELQINYSRTKSRLIKYHLPIEQVLAKEERGRMITYKNKTQTLGAWCKELGISYQRTIDRIDKCHWSIERAFSEKRYERKLKTKA